MTDNDDKIKFSLEIEISNRLQGRLGLHWEVTIFERANAIGRIVSVQKPKAPLNYDDVKVHESHVQVLLLLMSGQVAPQSGRTETVARHCGDLGIASAAVLLAGRRALFQGAVRLVKSFTQWRAARPTGRRRALRRHLDKTVT